MLNPIFPLDSIFNWKLIPEVVKSWEVDFGGGVGMKTLYHVIKGGKDESEEVASFSWTLSWPCVNNTL